MRSRTRPTILAGDKERGAQAMILPEQTMSDSLQWCSDDLMRVLACMKDQGSPRPVGVAMGPRAYMQLEKEIRERWGKDGEEKPLRSSVSYLFGLVVYLTETEEPIRFLYSTVHAGNFVGKPCTPTM